MNWKKLLKAIGIVLCLVLITLVVFAWIYFSYNDWRWFVGGLIFIALSCLVSYIYNNI